MRRSFRALVGLLLVAAPLVAQTAPSETPGGLLGMTIVEVIPNSTLRKLGRQGMGTDFQLTKAIHGHRLFAGLELRFGGVGPARRVLPRDSVFLRVNEKNTAQNSLMFVGVPIRYLFGSGQARPYLFGSLGAARWGVKAWNERVAESASLFPKISETHFEHSEGIGLLVLAHPGGRDWYVDLGLRRASSGTVKFMRREGFYSLDGYTVIERTPAPSAVYIFNVGVTALLH